MTIGEAPETGTNTALTTPEDKPENDSEQPKSTARDVEPTTEALNTTIRPTTASPTTASEAMEASSPSPVLQGVRNDSSAVVYSSDSLSDSRVRITISTLAPQPSVAPHSKTVSPGSMCPPRNIRALSWSWTLWGTEASMSCPLGTSGTATWRCEGEGEGRSSPHWSSPSPDLSDCQSLWVARIIGELRKSERVLGLASELMQYVAANPLYGGDIKSIINAVTIIAEKMQYQLSSVPTQEQREAMVMELAQSVTKTASTLLSEDNLPAWQDLPAAQQTRFLSNLLSALERTGALLPAALGQDREVSISSENLRK